MSMQRSLSSCLATLCLSSLMVGQKATKFEANNQGKAIPCSFTDDSAPVVLEDSVHGALVFSNVFKCVQMYCEMFVLCDSGQDDGSDTNPMVLCAALQAVEKSGMIDFSLAGHTCCRPPEVQQGRCDDRFDVAPTDEKLLWKANAVPAKSLKASNLASHFSYQQLKASPLVLVALFAFCWASFLFLHLFELDNPKFCVVSLNSSCGSLIHFDSFEVWRLRKYVTEKTVGAAKPLWYLPGDLGMIQGGVQRVI